MQVKNKIFECVMGSPSVVGENTEQRLGAEFGSHGEHQQRRNNSFTLEYRNAGDENLRVKLYDLLGNLLHDVALTASETKRTFLTDRYNSCVILIRVERNRENLYNSRVVIMK